MQRDQHHGDSRIPSGDEAAPALPSPSPRSASGRQAEFGQGRRQFLLPALHRDDVADLEAMACRRTCRLWPARLTASRLTSNVLRRLIESGEWPIRTESRRHDRLDHDRVRRARPSSLSSSFGAGELQFAFVGQQLDRGRVGLDGNDVVRVEEPVAMGHVVMAALARNGPDQRLDVAEMLEIADRLAGKRRVLRARAARWCISRSRRILRARQRRCGPSATAATRPTGTPPQGRTAASQPRKIEQTDRDRVPDPGGRSRSADLGRCRSA